MSTPTTFAPAGQGSVGLLVPGKADTEVVRQFLSGGRSTGGGAAGAMAASLPPSVASSKVVPAGDSRMSPKLAPSPAATLMTPSAIVGGPPVKAVQSLKKARPSSSPAAIASSSGSGRQVSFSVPPAGGKSPPQTSTPAARAPPPKFVPTPFPTPAAPLPPRVNIIPTSTPIRPSSAASSTQPLAPTRQPATRPASASPALGYSKRVGGKAPEKSLSLRLAAGSLTVPSGDRGRGSRSSSGVSTNVRPPATSRRLGGGPAVASSAAASTTSSSGGGGSGGSQPHQAAAKSAHAQLLSPTCPFSAAQRAPSVTAVMQAIEEGVAVNVGGGASLSMVENEAVEDCDVITAVEAERIRCAFLGVPPEMMASTFSPRPKSAKGIRGGGGGGAISGSSEELSSMLTSRPGMMEMSLDMMLDGKDADETYNKLWKAVEAEKLQEVLSLGDDEFMTQRTLFFNQLKSLSQSLHHLHQPAAPAPASAGTTLTATASIPAAAVDSHVGSPRVASSVSPPLTHSDPLRAANLGDPASGPAVGNGNPTIPRDSSWASSGPSGSASALTSPAVASAPASGGSFQTAAPLIHRMDAIHGVLRDILQPESAAPSGGDPNLTLSNFLESLARLELFQGKPNASLLFLRSILHYKKKALTRQRRRLQAQKILFSALLHPPAEPTSSTAAADASSTEGGTPLSTRALKKFAYQFLPTLDDRKRFDLELQALLLPPRARSNSPTTSSNNNKQSPTPVAAVSPTSKAIPPASPPTAGPSSNSPGKARARASFSGKEEKEDAHPHQQQLLQLSLAQFCKVLDHLMEAERCASIQAFEVGACQLWRELGGGVDLSGTLSVEFIASNDERLGITPRVLRRLIATLPRLLGLPDPVGGALGGPSTQSLSSFPPVPFSAFRACLLYVHDPNSAPSCTTSSALSSSLEILRQLGFRVDLSVSVPGQPRGTSSSGWDGALPGDGVTPVSSSGKSSPRGGNRGIAFLSFDGGGSGGGGGGRSPRGTASAGASRAPFLAGNLKSSGSSLNLLGCSPRGGGGGGNAGSVGGPQPSSGWLAPSASLLLSPPSLSSSSKAGAGAGGLPWAGSFLGLSSVLGSSRGESPPTAAAAIAAATTTTTTPTPTTTTTTTASQQQQQPPPLPNAPSQPGASPPGSPKSALKKAQAQAQTQTQPKAQVQTPTFAVGVGGTPKSLNRPNGAKVRLPMAAEPKSSTFTSTALYGRRRSSVHGLLISESEDTSAELLLGLDGDLDHSLRSSGLWGDNVNANVNANANANANANNANANSTRSSHVTSSSPKSCFGFGYHTTSGGSSESSASLRLKERAEGLVGEFQEGFLRGLRDRCHARPATAYMVHSRMLLRSLFQSGGYRPRGGAPKFSTLSQSSRPPEDGRPTRSEVISGLTIAPEIFGENRGRQWMVRSVAARARAPSAYAQECLSTPHLYSYML